MSDDDDMGDLDVLGADAGGRERVDVAAIVAQARETLNLGGFDPKAVAGDLRMSDGQLALALGLLRGLSKTDAYIQATGKKPPPKSDERASANFRSKAARMASSEKIANFLKRARELSAVIPSTPLDEDEQLRILAATARSATGLLRVQAINAYRQCRAEIDERDNDPNARHDPIATLREIARVSLLCAVLSEELAEAHGLKFVAADALSMTAAEVQEQAAVRERLETRARLRGVEMGDARD